jgi:peptide/nickel transport system permease protein
MMVTTLALISAPVFWLGLVSLYLFAKDVGQFPLFPGQGSYTEFSEGPLDWAYALVLPWLVLAAAFAAIYARYMRSSMIDVMSEDYIRTARAKGVPERRVVVRHGVRSAITPIVTLLGVDVGLLLAGNAILTESVFNIPGVGRLLYTSIERADLPVIQGVVLFGALFIVMLNLIVDIVYAYLDPRVRY